MLKKNPLKIPKFYPCRQGKIVDVIKEGNVYHFYFALDDRLVDYRQTNGIKDYNGPINRLVEKPLTTDSKQLLPGKFVTLEQFQEDISLSNDLDTWDFIIKKIGELDTYKSTLFCKIKGIFNIETNNELSVYPFEEDISGYKIHNSGYKIKSDSKYNLKIILRIGVLCKRELGNRGWEKRVGTLYNICFKLIKNYG